MSRQLCYNLIVLIVLGNSCTTTQGGHGSKPPRSSIHPHSESLEINSTVFHRNDSVSDVFLQVINEHLLYHRPDTSKAFYAELVVSYRLLKETKTRVLLDSGTVKLLDRYPTENVPTRVINGQFQVKARAGSDYLVEVDFFEVIRKTVIKKNVRLQKQHSSGSQHFLLQSNDSIAFTNRFAANKELKVLVNGASLEKVTVDYFSKNFGPALPPFSTRTPDPFKYKPDSTFEIPLYNNQFLFNTPKRGFYHFKKDAADMRGLSVYTVDESFPGVSNSQEMIECTRYIMFREEFETCREAVDKKRAIDEFWLKLGGSVERARELLKRYYTRVQDANKLYSSYTQGWKTDRGMIYIVLGPPSNTYRSAAEEVWMYGNENTPNALRFVFNKTENPFSENDFVMERSPFYKEPYHTAVEYWRQGQIYVDRR